MWSFGCIVAELFQSKPLFAGQSDIEQLGIVTSALGEPPFFWAQQLPDYNKIIFNQTADQTEGTWLDQLEQSLTKARNDRTNKESTDEVSRVINLIGSVIKYTQRKTAQQLFNNHRLFNEIRDTGIEKDKLIKCSMIKQMTGPKKR